MAEREGAARVAELAKGIRVAMLTTVDDLGDAAVFGATLTGTTRRKVVGVAVAWAMLAAISARRPRDGRRPTTAPG
jgi:hypothetical protein